LVKFFVVRVTGAAERDTAAAVHADRIAAGRWIALNMNTSVR
jgi:hypothetical protein